MNENNIGKFIAELRKEKKLRQKDLADQLNITDKAVSKWERSISCPDITLLPSIAEILGVTTSELINGHRNKSEPMDADHTLDNVLLYASESTVTKMEKFQHIFSIIFTGLLLLGAIICVICDIAMSGTLTWSFYPISSIIFSWFIIYPLIKLGTKGIRYSLLFFSVLIIPFLYVIHLLVGESPLMMPIGIGVSILSILYMWIIYFTFKKLKNRKTLAGSISLLLLIPTYSLVNLVVSNYTTLPVFDIGDVISISIVMVLSILLFIMDYKKRLAH